MKLGVQAVLLASFLYSITSMAFTPWILRFPMQIVLPLIVSLLGLGLFGSLTNNGSLTTVPSLLGLFLAIPVRISEATFYGCYGIVSFPVTLSVQYSRHQFVHAGINLVPAALLVAFLYLSFKSGATGAE